MTIDNPGKSPHGNILNYSIVSSDEEANPLIVKLKVSENNKHLLVALQRLEDVNQDSNLLGSLHSSRVLNKDVFLSSLSLESVQTDLSGISPKTNSRNRSSPRKACVDILQEPKDNAETHLNNLCYSITNKMKLTTPSKRSLSKSDSSDLDCSNLTPVKKTRATRNSRQANENETSSKRRLCVPIRYRDECSPKNSAKVNLNMSFQRSALRTRQNIENISGNSKEGLGMNKTAGSIRRSNRIAPLQNYYALDDSDEFEKNVVGHSAKGRSLRLRINSIDDNYITSKTRSRRRLRSNSSTNTDNSPETPKLKSVNLESTKSSRVLKTPRNRRQSIATPKRAYNTPKTPKNRLKLLRDGAITPSMHARSSHLQDASTPLMKARSQLHVSYVPKSLPCREKEYLDVYSFLRNKLEDNCGGCMYISGVPGTGKTATVTSVIESLMKDKEVSKFIYVSINGMRLTEPRQSYVEVWKQLTGKTMPWEQAQSLLEERFTKKKNMVPVVMLIDELDILCTKRQDVVYNLLDWPTKSKDQLIVVTIANTMDLPERLLMSRVTSRLGLTRLTFQAYTHKQLMEIVTKRLIGTDSFNPDAIQLVARKVASVSGDARRALDICRRAAEIAETEGKSQLVNITHINEALTAMITQPQVMAIRRCSRLQKLLLQAVVAEIERTGVEETTFADALRMLVSCCALDGFKMVSVTAAQRAFYQLSACKLILTDQKNGDIYQKVVLNVSVHDVYFALKQE